MAQKDVDAIIAHHNSGSPFKYKLEGCSRSKAYAIKRAIDKKLNIHDQFCEVDYDKETQTARFDIVT